MKPNSKESGVRRGLRVWTFAIIGGLLVLLMVTAAACDDARTDTTPETTGTPQGSTNTETPLLTDAPSPESTKTPKATANVPPTTTPTLAATGTPTLAPTPTYSSPPTATSIPGATPTPEPTQAPTPTPKDKEHARAHLSEIISWFLSPPDTVHSAAAEAITAIWLRDSSLGDAVANMPWVADSVEEDEQEALLSLRSLSEIALDLGKDCTDL